MTTGEAQPSVGRQDSPALRERTKRLFAFPRPAGAKNHSHRSVIVGATHIEAEQARRTMAWIILGIAGVFEVGWAVGLKYTQGFTRLTPSVLTVISMAVSLGLLGLALRTLPLGTAYAVWTGIGSIGTAILGIWLLGESASPVRLACIGLIVAGLIGLKLVSPE